MATPAVTPPTTDTFQDRAQALGHFFARAGEAPRLVAYDDEVGCPLESALAVLEWTGAVGILVDGDLVHAARLSGETAAVMLERRRDGRRIFVYMGPRMDAPPADPHEGELLFDEPGVRAYEFVQRAHALAHFIRATQGSGAVICMLSKRAPELRHVKRGLTTLLQEPDRQGSNKLVAGWFATNSVGVLFAPAGNGDPYVYEEIAASEE
ncbi:MAG: hypothetical protein O7I93_09850 [Gemmatimonadetes bacterium]|nr:hypothetical protein [Gemmatimonadota bacterium]